MESTSIALREYVGAFVDELTRAGVTDVCICPGSRSTPLALLLRDHPAVRVWMHLDERSAAFFALGIGKAQRRPAAVVCTSGTAAANFMPAVVEARYANVPLLVLTADRPPELRDIGANQTIDQVRLYGSHVKFFETMLLPEATPEAVRHARAMAVRAVAETMTRPAGTVHLNFPFREPLIPAPPPGNEAIPATAPPAIGVARSTLMAEESELNDLADPLARKPRGLIVCGPMDEEGFPEAVVGLARRLNCPVLVDALSQVRCGPHFAAGDLIDCYDAFLRNSDLCADLAPDFILRFGGAPVSKPLLQYLERHSRCLQVVIGEGAWIDPARTAGHFVFAAPVAFCRQLERALLETQPFSVDGQNESEHWLSRWRDINERASRALAATLDTAPAVSETSLPRRLARLLPEDAVVFAGNSMPVRDLDSFFPAGERPVRFLANRGASGIDGVVSTALGVAAVSEVPVVLILGDLSLYHDMNGLFAARRHSINATIIVVNNNGGGIFSFLPQAEQGEHFEELFGTPHGLDFRHAAELYGLRYTLAGSTQAFDEAVTRSLTSTGVEMIEVRTQREENLALHRKLWSLAASAASRG